MTMIQRAWLPFLGSLSLILAAACTPAAASIIRPTQPGELTPTPNIDCATSSGVQMEICPLAGTGSPTAAQVSPIGPAAPEAATLTPTITPTATSLPPSSTPAPPTPTACPPDLCSYAAQFFLSRPIAPTGNDKVDVTYRFGNTQGKKREPHHGVEFLNPYGTPVLAAADGLVVVAGSDKEPTSERGVWPITYYGMFSNFYGNLVVIEHQTPVALLPIFPDLPQPIYTLYAHLSEVSITVGQQVKAGQEIGKVGMAGVAQGPHLHFEVRLGENIYSAARNPELWLIPHAGENGQANGALAGNFIDSYGNNLQKTSIVLEYLPNGPDQPANSGPEALLINLRSYEEKALLGQPPWGESFAVGDIPAGWYRVSFPHGGLERILVQVFPGQLTMVTFRVE